MDIATRLSMFTAADAAVLLLFLIAWAGIGWAVEYPPASRPSVTVLMAGYRREWMRQFVTRQPRIFDATVIDSLRQATSFYASACMIAIGGGLALIGNAERVLGVAADLSLSESPVVVWEMKLIVVVLMTVNAFLKFVWAHRLFGYCAVLMAAVPNDAGDPRAYAEAARAAEININAARSFNRGMHSIYFALAALGWLLGPAMLLLASAVVSATLIRRDFASQSRQALLGHDLPQ
ncbi:MAG: DUF599 domain-containing protein [Paracoccaceae bacterium]